MVSPVLRLEFVRAHDGKPTGPPLELPKFEPRLPAVVDTRPKLPTVTNGGVPVPYRFPRS
jgi:hypothetical protein